ncbi:MAG: GNAT family N-acetyltransferase [Methylococcaceae bacterium]
MIKIAQTDSEIAACFPVMVQLRPHLHAEAFVPQIRELMANGYCLAYLIEAESVVSVAGFKLDQNLFAGKHLYVEDLVTCERNRSKGYGERMMAWLTAYAQNHHCAVIHLDSGVQRHGAHRFYLKQRLNIVCYHFLARLDTD